jgi:hypothetical protein
MTWVSCVNVNGSNQPSCSFVRQQVEQAHDGSHDRKDSPIADRTKDAKARARQLATGTAAGKQQPAGVLFAAVLAELRTHQVRGELVWSVDGRHCALVRDGRAICLIYRQQANGVRVEVALTAEQILTTYVTDMQRANLVARVIAHASSKPPASAS